MPVAIVEEPEAVRQADRILFPGWGPLVQRCSICEILTAGSDGGKSPVRYPTTRHLVGAQLLMELGQEDGPHQGLGWIAGEVSRFEHQLKIPQIGWNEVEIRKPDLLFQGLRDRSPFTLCTPPAAK